MGIIDQLDTIDGVSPDSKVPLLELTQLPISGDSAAFRLRTGLWLPKLLIARLVGALHAELTQQTLRQTAHATPLLRKASDPDRGVLVIQRNPRRSLGQWPQQYADLLAALKTRLEHAISAAISAYPLLKGVRVVAVPHDSQLAMVDAFGDGDITRYALPQLLRLDEDTVMSLMAALGGSRRFTLVSCRSRILTLGHHPDGDAAWWRQTHVIVEMALLRSTSCHPDPDEPSAGLLPVPVVIHRS